MVYNEIKTFLEQAMNNKLFGTIDGKDVYLYTLKSECATAEIMTRGATLVRLTTYGVDIVGGFATLERYLEDTSHQGATIGRIANRVANASFTMDGAIYMLPDNDHGNCLHGGVGFDARIWSVKDASDSSITLTYYSEDGEEGFPSGLNTEVTYTLTDATLLIDYKATPEGKTPIALTNHSYFNLDGFGDTIYDHKAKIHANCYTEVDDKLIPTGKHIALEGTPYDFRAPRTLGECIGDDFGGYDVNFVISPSEYAEFIGKKLALAAEVENGTLRMSVYTDQPGIQLYTANFLKKCSSNNLFHGDIDPIKHGAFCLETQTEPNCVNHGIGFYDAGEVYTHTTVYKIEKK